MAPKQEVVLLNFFILELIVRGSQEVCCSCWEVPCLEARCIEGRGKEVDIYTEIRYIGLFFMGRITVSLLFAQRR